MWFVYFISALIASFAIAIIIAIMVGFIRAIIDARRGE